MHDIPSDLVVKRGELYRARKNRDCLQGTASLDTPKASLPTPVRNTGRCKWLFKEAFFYEETQSLQGIAVPRCYEFYHAPGNTYYICLVSQNYRPCSLLLTSATCCTIGRACSHYNEMNHIIQFNYYIDSAFKFLKRELGYGNWHTKIR